jgi:flagellar hook-associated protein FlgK
VLGFSIGLSALRTAQQSMDVVGQNVANASTPGYSRRLALLGSNDPLRLGGFSLGTGVTLQDLQRVHDDLLEQRIREQRQSLGSLESSGSLLQMLEGSFQEPSDHGVSARLDDLWSAFSDLTRSPDDPTSRAGLVQTAQSLAATFRQVASQVDSVGADARAGVADGVNEVNSLLAKVAAVNKRILATRGSGPAPGDLLDQRDQLLQSLAEWVAPQTIARPDGSVDVLVDGVLMVSGDRAHTLAAKSASDGSITLALDGGRTTLAAGGGKLQGYLDVAQVTAPARRAQLDQVAHQLILELNRLHATAAPTQPYTRLTSAVAVGPNELGVPLGSLGSLPFPVSNGRLTVNVVDSTTGAVEQHFVSIDPKTTTLNDVVAALSAIPHLAASVDSTGHLVVEASAGHGFDFSARLVGAPDEAHSFGSDVATLTSASGPFALANGDTLQLSVDGGAPMTVTFAAGSFADVTHATADEVAAAINAQATGVTASAQDGRLVLKSNTAGAAGSIQVVAASNSALFAPGTSDVGSDTAVSVQLTGSPTDGTSGHFTLKALSDGVIGLTPGLKVALLDEHGTTVSTFDVGSGYTPGDSIEVAPGVKLTLSAGSVQASAGDAFGFDLVGNSDSSDLLAALQVGAFLTGSSASDVDVASALVADPRLVAGSRTGEAGDGGSFEAMVALKDRALDALGGLSIAQSYGDVVAGVGRDVSANQTASDAQQQLLTSLSAQRDSISGVNTDEEMLKLVEYQHLYQAAGRYLQSVNQVTDTLFQMFP